MLNALELVGFKSFADKTRFAFPPGVTVIVGPNGSGKSNIVDAIKWVLGAQSVKSLRGKEMADVIFNGSGERSPLNTAETTLTFDNSTRRLAIDAPEVAITRRVYRSGEGEYLINQQPCRLRDIRDLFAGTGIATEAYSVIEQGKVDVMLQSSPRDRRLIFEEAAGISRFRLKKLEAMRRLDRVDQNMLRLSDIVEEVESRLRSVRTQATKAQRYREHTNRLQELRTQVGLTDWKALTEQLEIQQRTLTTLGDERGQLDAKLESIEAESLGLETKINDENKAIHTFETHIASNRERIAAAESTVTHERIRSRDLEEQVTQYRCQLTSLNTRARELKEQLNQICTTVEEAENQFCEGQDQLKQAEGKLAKIAVDLETLQRASGRRRSQHVEEMRTAADLKSQMSALDSQISASEEAQNQLKKRLDQVNRTCETLQNDLGNSKEEQERLVDLAKTGRQKLDRAQTELASMKQQLARDQKKLIQLHVQHTGATERAAVLLDLERRLEGLGAGVKQVLVQARQRTTSPFQHIRGLVAELFQVDVETAPLLEVALGDFAQYLVVNPDHELIEFLESTPHSVQGRVGFIRLNSLVATDEVEDANLAGHPDIVGRADSFVETLPEFVPLLRKLLGRTYFVKTLTQARTLAETMGRGFSFVTRNGELFTGDGTLVVGPRNSGTGLISRRSELRAIQETISRFEKQISTREIAVKNFEESILQKEEQLCELSEYNAQQIDAINERRLKSTAMEERLEHLSDQRSRMNEERQILRVHTESTTSELLIISSRFTAIEAKMTRLEEVIGDDTLRYDTLNEDRVKHQHDVTQRQIELAKSEQRLDSLRHQLVQFQQDRAELGRTLSDSREQLQQCQTRVQQSQRTILQTVSEIAELYLRKESLAKESVARLEQREAYSKLRIGLARQGQNLRHQLRSVEQNFHQSELEVHQLEHQRQALADRMQEDYNICFADVKHQSSDEEIRRREEVEQEIRQLRQTINNMGGVNLNALEELDELDSRYQSLASQYRDLDKAKGSLEQIINRINADSRRLFSATLETVRGHFQVLFSKLFGGGHADIVLDDEEQVDILEGGIEIVARPPGKEPRSISLLSGGEKTLTCVALLLSIFRSHPSPFCVLDEVDAALDEANIERFIGVLTEFLTATQFIVVTHSKKTMTAANTLYGVTMQESGVSKRVAVRFDDVSDNGKIRRPAIESSANKDVTREAPDGDDKTQAA